MFTSSAACASVTRPGSPASSRVFTDVTITATWYAPTTTGFNGSGHKHAARRTLS
jgi:hypothetical protein